MITKQLCGFCVPPDNPIAFVEAPEQAAVDCVALEASGERGLSLVETQFDRIKLVARWVDSGTGVTR
jgi:hypothetical protein